MEQEPPKAKSLWSLDAPWVHIVGADEPVEGLLADADPGGVTVILDARRMSDFAGFMAECQRGFKFPDYFGGNWPALDECLVDLSWLPGRSYHVVVAHGGELLRGDPSELPTLLRTLESAGQTWSRSFALGPEWGGGEVPFNTVIIGTPPER
jgi:hypothetical protein